jgi:hypothetical protein
MTSERQITVKLASRAGRKEGGTNLANQCPNNKPRWGHCHFVCDLFHKDYDWLVLMDDFSPLLPGRSELLQCPQANTLLLTSEPASVTQYGKAFAAQFAHLLTNQGEDAVPHPNAIRSQTGNVWYYGKPYATLIEEAPPPKTQLISTLCSAKQQQHTLHAKRYAFTQALKTQLPELEIFGHGVRFIENKYEALDPYKFHLVVENHIGRDVWTEKLADALLGYTVPIYCGCPNVYDYFPEDSLIRIDIHDFEGSLKKINEIVSRPGEYERRLDAVIEARRRVTEDYNLPAMLSRIIESAPPAASDPKPITLRGRKVIRARHPMELLRHARWSWRKILRRPQAEI